MDPQRSGGRPVPPRSHQAQAPHAAPAAPQHTAVNKASGGRSFWSKWGIIIVCVAIALAVVGLTLDKLGMIGERAAVKKNQYQAVFLTNNQVYFGKVIDMNPNTITLRDVYYLRNASNSTKDQQQQTDQQQQVSLAKLGESEVHGPEDEMHLDRRQVLFWENIRDDSQVTKAIKQDKDHK